MSMLSGDGIARPRTGLRQSGITTAEFLDVLFAGTLGREDFVEIRFLQPVKPSDWFGTAEFGRIAITEDHNMFFGCLPRQGYSTTPVSRGRLVWCDVDKREITPHMVYPPPTAVVRSGRQDVGHHLYWRLDREVSHDHLIQLLKLATLAWDGDPACAEAARVLRLPGSYNLKKGYGKPLVECVHLDDNNEYDPDDLGNRLLAQALHPFFGQGMRHEMAFALGACLFRALWTVERAEQVVRQIARLQPGMDALDCVKACCGAWDRSDEKKLRSASLKDAFRDRWGLFLEALGIKSNEGDLVLEGVVVGRKEFAEQDLVSFFLTPPSGPRLWACAAGQIQRWTGRCWQASDRDQMHSWVFEQMARMTVVAGGDVERFKARSALAGAVVKGMLGRLLTEEMPASDPAEMPIANGIFNLCDRTISGHRPEGRHRWVHETLTYDPEATCPTWEGFLDFAVDEEERALLQEFAGYCLMGSNPWQRMLWLYGPSGTGKSTYLKVLMELLGSGAVTLPADGLSEYALASLDGKRLGLCSELSPKTLHTAMFKQLVSSDPIHVRQIYGKPFDLKYTGKLMWTSNGLPRLDQGEGVWRRVMIVEFKNSPAYPDNLLDAKLRRELAGIFNWALAGYDRLQEYLATPTGAWPLPASVTKFVEEYKEAANLFAQFAEEELDFGPDFVCQGRDIHQRYREWAKDRGLEDRAIEQWGPEFYKVLMSHGLGNVGPKRVKDRVVRLWSGAKLRGTTVIVTEHGIEQE